MSFMESVGFALVRSMSPEEAHRLTIRGLKYGLVKPNLTSDPVTLATRLPISGLVLKNPVGLAAGFDKNAEVFGPMLGYGFGFVECGTVTPRPQAGNPKPRLFRLTEDEAVINRMGFNNDGLGLVVRRLVKGREDPIAVSGVVGANVGANKTSEGDARIADYVAGVRGVWPYCSYITINISSPNTPGLRGLQEKGALEDLLGAVADAARDIRKPDAPIKPIFLKIAPDMDEVAVADIVDVVLAAGQITGLIVSNTTIERFDTLTSPQKQETGGLSGKPLFEKSTMVLKQAALAAAGRLDIIGAGGVHDADTAYAKIRAGAHAVQLYSALVYGGPGLVREIKAGLTERLRRDGFKSVSDAVGVA
ncbi:MAG: dihydroorotate dehydrogenase (quinone) [Hirschia sp.]|nr:dihydroorotate dehydrogenase (quinone) [Hirschia sp.]MBF19948.1 dihydroorotate dehydrogenase (quinone) [Hirschia sp.]